MPIVMRDPLNKENPNTILGRDGKNPQHVLCEEVRTNYAQVFSLFLEARFYALAIAFHSVAKRESEKVQHDFEKIIFSIRMSIEKYF